MSSLDEGANEARNSLKINELDKAVKAGRLKVDGLRTNKVDSYELLVRLSRNKDIEHLLEKPSTEMVQEVMNLMFSPSRLYPFVDSKFGEAFQLSAQMSNNKPPLNRVQVNKAKNISLVSQMFEMLPTFEKASLDEILSINNELSDALVRFRGAVGEYAELIESTSWDSGFEAEAAKVFEEKLKPSIQEIEERVEYNSYLRQLNSQVLSSASRHLSLLGTALTSNAANWAAFQVSALVELGSLSFDTVWAARKKLDESRNIEREKLFFYYKLKNRFGNPL